jgi:hypothetical protein
MKRCDGLSGKIFTYAWELTRLARGRYQLLIVYEYSGQVYVYVNL